MEQPLNQTFPLWIEPWISGVYSFHYPDRCVEAEACGGNIPAVLTAYIDEVGESTLMMHVLDFTEIDGGEIEWCHWVGVRWRGGDRVSLFGREDEGWGLIPQMDIPLSIDEIDDLLAAKELAGKGKTKGDSVTMAKALLPHLPFVHLLSIWDGESLLDYLQIDDEELEDHPSLVFVRDREVLPLIEKNYIRSAWHERQTYVGDISKMPRHPDHNFTMDLLRRNR